MKSIKVDGKRIDFPVKSRLLPRKKQAKRDYEASVNSKSLDSFMEANNGKESEVDVRDG